MKRRDFLKTLGAAVACPSIVRALAPDDVDYSKRDTTTCSASGTKPNIILVLCDDLGYGDLGFFGQNARELSDLDHIDTPNLDAAMEQGVMLTHSYTSSPVCAPARASIVTGKNQGHCNLRNNMFDRPIDASMTIGTVLKKAGYTTWHIGKWGIGGGYESGGQPRRAMACDAGFDYSYGYPAHAHGHSFYHWVGENTSGTTIDWRTSKVGSPIVENVSAEAYAAGTYADLSEGYDEGSGAMDFELDSEGTYYRRAISNEEIRYCYDTDLFTAKIKQLINNHLSNNRTEPFFCFACYTTVHGAGSGTDSTYSSGQTQGDRTISGQLNFHVPGKEYPASDTSDTTWAGGVTWVKDDNGYLPFKEGTSADDNTSNTYIYPEYTDYGTYEQRYATNVRRLDDAIGDLLTFLEVRGLKDNTMFVFTSDNGPAGEYIGSVSTSNRINWVEKAFDSNGPFKGMKRWVNEGGMREPTFVLWPKYVPADATTPRTSDFPFQFPAWMATFADVAGLPQPAHCDGISILPTLTGEGRQLPMRIYAEQYDAEGTRGFAQMVRDGNYVLLRNGGVSGTAYLYNVIEDEYEATDLSSENAARAAWMKDLLVSCRIPASKVPAACGAAGYYDGGNATGVDALTMPATPLAGNLPPWEVRVFRTGADTWPWVPNFRTMLPEAGFLATDADAVATKLSAESVTAYGVSLRGWIEVSTETDVTFSATGAGGCQLWLHEAHILEYEAGDCTDGVSITMTLAAGRHPIRLYATTTGGLSGLCAVTAGSTTLLTNATA